MRSHLLEGKVRHRRSRPVEYALEHDVWYAALDLSEIGAVDRSMRLLSRNARNLVAFRDDDHWPAPVTDLNATLLAHLEPVDLVIIEGFKREPHPKIEIHRAANAKPWMHPETPGIRAVAADAAPPYDLPYAALEDVAAIADFCLRFAEPVQ